MANDLISRSALIKRCEEIAACDWNKKAAPVSWSDAYEGFAVEVDDAPAVDAAPKWISVEERLPEHEDRVLVACRTKKGAQSINLAYHSDGFWHGQGSMSGVTHWMPLPDLPEVS